MNLLETLLGSTGTVDAMAGKLGLESKKTSDVLTRVVPAMSRGLQRSASSPEGIASLSSALARGGHQRYLDKASELTSAAGIADGNAILGHILGSKEVSRQLAASTAEMTGVGSDIVKKLLPMIAAAAMGGLAKTTRAGSRGFDATGLSSKLPSILDADGDGSVTDDLFGMVGKLFK